jgi:thiol-disulfide isomerase/thioredoxin
MIAVAALALCALAALFGPGRPDKDAAGFLVDATGRPTPLGRRLEPVTVLHFWATWCPPCVTEIPAILRLRQDFAEPGAVAVLLVAVADSPEQVRTFLGGAAGEALFDPRWEVAHRYGTQQLPETYVLVRGRVAAKFTGATEWDSPAVREQLRGLDPALAMVSASARLPNRAGARAPAVRNEAPNPPARWRRCGRRRTGT